MTRIQGKEYLKTSLKSLVSSDSFEMVLEYLLSFDPINEEEMITFLQEVCHTTQTRNGLKEIIKRYHQICQQLDSSATIFKPKGQQKQQQSQSVGIQTTVAPPPVTNTITTGGKSTGIHKVKNTPTETSITKTSKSKTTPPATSQAPANGLVQDQNQKKKIQPPSHQQSLTFVDKKESKGSTHSNLDAQKNSKKSKPQKKTEKSESTEQRHRCGCFATHHPFYTSCIYCGRIHCTHEGPGNCIFCGADLVPPTDASLASIMLGYDETNEMVQAAYAQKDKLLTFDKEHAKRTQVHDAQGDYYETGTWLTQEEKDDIAEKEKKRLEKYQSRGRQPTKISFDLAGRKIYEATTEEIDCCADDKDVPTEISIPPLNDDYLTFPRTGSEQSHQGNDLDILTLSLENVSLANNFSKHAIMYRTLRERYTYPQQLDSTLRLIDSKGLKDNSSTVGSPPLVDSSVDQMHQLKVQHSLEM